MIDLFTPFKSVFLKFGNVTTDNYAFRMHYRVTSVMFLVFSLLVTTKQFFGEPIHCIGSDGDAHKDAMNSYCWIYGTYTLKSTARQVETYPGVHTPQDGDIHIRHAYYQWVCFVLLAQAVMFYVPRYLWKMWEGGRLKALVGDLNGPVVTKDWSECRRRDLIMYFNDVDAYTHKMYALKFVFCEALNFINAVGQIFLLDSFLGGSFRNYGAAVAAFSHVHNLPGKEGENSLMNPMDEFFPKLTKCWWKDFGPSGSLQLKDRICVLSLNIVNEKIFVVIWFWLIILACVSGLAILFRVLVMSLRFFRVILVAGRVKYARIEDSALARIVNRFTYGDWFVLNLLGKNMNPLVYKDFLVELSKEMDEKKLKV